MTEDLYLAIDVGTGSARAALVDMRGSILAIVSREHEQIVPQYGWSEQRAEDWWAGVVYSIRGLLDAHPEARSRIAAICACGQMHGTVLVDSAGELVRPLVPLWNDKRTASLVQAFEQRYVPDDYLAASGNPPTPAWPAFKLQWLRDHEPQAYARTAAVMMPKDYVNFRLTGEIAQDFTEASCSFLMDPQTRQWSARMLDLLGLRRDFLPRLMAPQHILGGVSAAAARESGLAVGTPVLVGGGDYPVALLGSGVSRPGLGSDVTGTSCIITSINRQPLLDAEVCNVADCNDNWGAFVLLESGGDAMRWARRAFHDNSLSYADISRRAVEAPAGSNALLFSPYLSGERLGKHRNARAQFFGIAANHGLAHLHRAVLEGVAFAVARHIQIMTKASGQPLERVIASGGGARSELWLKIKASIYGIPIAVPQEPECGVIGCAALAAAAVGQFGSAAEAADSFVRYGDDVLPDPAWVDIYQRMQPTFNRLYLHSQALYDDLDKLAL